MQNLLKRAGGSFKFKIACILKHPKLVMDYHTMKSTSREEHLSFHFMFHDNDNDAVDIKY